MRKFPAIVAVALCVGVVAATGPMQGTTRVATTADALLASAVFYHGKHVVIEHDTIGDTGLTRLVGTPRPIFVFWKNRATAGKGEIRGEFWDLGRVEQSDGRFAGYDFTTLIDATSRGRWPRRDEVYVILGATHVPSDVAPDPTVRAIALAPGRHDGRDVKVVGRFRGRNLYGDLPQALGKTKWDFVLQSAEGAVWVTGMRPKGKGFDLDPGARVDTGRWLEVRGVVSMIGSTPYITSTAMQLAAAPAETAVEVAVPVLPRLPVPEVIFSAPVDDDREVERAAPVRMQFSRDVDPQTVTGRVKVSYVSAHGAAAAPAAPMFTVTYNDTAHAVEIRFAQPLGRFQQVKVELLEGVLSLDGQAVKPWTIVFTTGG